jgi:homoserine dehydrogenase
MLTENRDVVRASVGAPVELLCAVDIRETDLPGGVSFSTDLTEALARDEVRIVVETIGGTGVAYDYTRQALCAGRHVVTSNKALVAAHGDELLEIARKRGVRYLFEASVGGGVPIVRPIATCLSGNRIARVDGIVNGSTNYLLTSMEKSGASFPDALKAAQALGYVEGNPDADIKGWDARRKITILAHAAFSARLALDERIPTQGIDEVTDEDLAVAAALDARGKLIAHARRAEEKGTGWVAPALVARAHPFFGVDGAKNAIRVHGDFVGDVLFEGQGAGSFPTASAVVGDVIDIARHVGEAVRGEPAAAPEFFVDAEERTRYVARIEGAVPGNITEIARSVPGGEVRKIRERAVLMTAALTQKEWALTAERLSAMNIRIGVGLKIFD